MNRIKELRQAAGLSQEALGRVLGCHSATVSKYELEQRQLDPATISMLCDHFNVTADYLIGRSDYRHSIMSKQQAKMLNAYDRAIPEIQDAVDRLLAPYMENASGKTGS